MPQTTDTRAARLQSASRDVAQAARLLARALKTLDGDAFSGEIEDHRDDLDRVAGRLSEYAEHGW